MSVTVKVYSLFHLELFSEDSISHILITFDKVTFFQEIQ